MPTCPIFEGPVTFYNYLCTMHTVHMTNCESSLQLTLIISSNHKQFISLKFTTVVSSIKFLYSIGDYDE